MRACLAMQQPQAAEEGMGGTYYLCNEAGKRVAIIKPCDEEPFAPNNPKARPALPRSVHAVYNELSTC
jgi:hypothetical protein